MSDLARFCSNCGAPLVDLSADAQVQATGNLDAPVSSTGPLGAVGGGSVGSVAPGTAMLIVRRGPSEGTSFVLDSDLVTVGRSDDADVVLDDVTVSRRHAEFIRDARGWQCRDVGSLNGTYVNRERIETTALSGGDEVQIGKYRFVFLVGGGKS
jgi:pSer/pThr/pTyr-binding forkhead associated (FHA) protein